MSRKACYALYHGDDFIDLGTAEELSERNGVQADTIRYYATQKHKTTRWNGTGYVVIRIEEDDEYGE